MTRRFRRMAWVLVFALASVALPSTALAQRHPPAGGAPHHGVAVPRAHAPYHPSHGGPYYRPYYYRPYYYRYPYYSRYYPYYYSPWSFSFGVGFGIGSYWGAYAPWYGYRYSYPYPYPYPYSYPYPYYGYPSPSSGYSEPGAAPSSGAPEAYSTAPATDPDEHSGYGRVSIQVMPAGATILVDGQPWDIPPDESRFSIELAAGPHQLEIRKDGYGSYVRAIDVPRGRTILWNVSLTAGGSTQVVRTVPLIAARR